MTPLGYPKGLLGKESENLELANRKWFFSSKVFAGVMYVLVHVLTCYFKYLSRFFV